MADTDFDVLVLGAGSGGYACALRAAQLGLRVGLVEQDKVGGTCLHLGCIPTKALLQAADVADAARGSERFGVRTTFEGIDMPEVNAYKDGVVSRLHAGLTGLVSSRGITTLSGRGRLSGPREITVQGADRAEVHTAGHVVIATGSTPRSLPGMEPDGLRVLTSEQALGLDYVPSSVIVLGGGVIGAEFASLWRSFGAEVTILEALPRLIAGEDVACSTALERAFRKRGITVRTDTPVTGVKPGESSVAVSIEGEETLEAELLLVAVGRAPLTAGLGLEQQGVALDRGFVVTDEIGRTSLDGVLAVGDVVSGPQLAHRGFAQGIVVAEVIAGLDPEPVDDLAVPRVTYSHPEVASVGLSEDAARQQFGADQVETVTYDLAGNGKSQILKTTGFVKLVGRVGGPLVGLHLLGDRVGELIGEAQLIYGWQAHAEDVAPLVHAHPTQSEALGEAHLALAGKPLHSHR